MHQEYHSYLKRETRSENEDREKTTKYIGGFEEDCSISSASAMEILQYFIKPSIWLCL